MIWAGEVFAHNLDFSAGQPTGAVVYSVLRNDDVPLAGLSNVSVTIANGAVSHLLIIPGSAHTVSTDLFEKRTLIWSFMTSDGVVNGRLPYRVEKPIPFPVSRAGVKTKLGLTADELGDEFIDLTRAYASFSEAADLSAYESSGDYNSLVLTEAIEALAALNLIPRLQLLVARSEDSGTNAFTRYADVDWDRLAAHLQEILDRGLNLIVPPLDELAGITIFFAAGPTTDPFTGEDYT